MDGYSLSDDLELALALRVVEPPDQGVVLAAEADEELPRRVHGDIVVGVVTAGETVRQRTLPRNWRQVMG